MLQRSSLQTFFIFQPRPRGTLREPGNWKFVIHSFIQLHQVFLIRSTKFEAGSLINCRKIVFPADSIERVGDLEEPVRPSA